MKTSTSTKAKFTSFEQDVACHHPPKCTLLAMLVACSLGALTNAQAICSNCFQAAHLQPIADYHQVAGWQAGNDADAATDPLQQSLAESREQNHEIQEANYQSQIDNLANSCTCGGADPGIEPGDNNYELPPNDSGLDSQPTYQDGDGGLYYMANIVCFTLMA
jgi:hypothetical protein